MFYCPYSCETMPHLSGIIYIHMQVNELYCEIAITNMSENISNADGGDHTMLCSTLFVYFTSCEFCEYKQ